MNLNRAVLAVVEIKELGPLHERILCEWSGCETELTATMQAVIAASREQPGEVDIHCTDHYE